jgi:hypothetical protein
VPPLKVARDLPANGRLSSGKLLAPLDRPRLIGMGRPLAAVCNLVRAVLGARQAKGYNHAIVPPRNPDST